MIKIEGTQSKGTLKSGTTREAKNCPVPLCGSKVIHLSRHLKDVHGWSREKSRTAVTRFGMRKNYTYSDPEKAPKPKKVVKEETSTDENKVDTNDSKRKDYHKHHYCPAPGCMSLVKRIPPHLKLVHKLDPTSKEYKDLLSKVRGPVKESHMRPYNERPRYARDDTRRDTEEEDHASDTVTSQSAISDTGVPEFAIQFEAWLKSADGGNLDQKTSRQHRKQISKLLEVIDVKQEVASLFNPNIINDKFLEGHAKDKYHPKTTKSYLMSLRHFYSFALNNDCGVSISKEDILSVKEKVTRWSSSFRKSCSKRHWQRMEEDLHALITPEQIAEFEKSQATRDAICLLGQLSGAHCMEISQANYTLIRDFLLVEVSIDNASRAGGLAKMTMEELNSAVKHDDEYVVHVCDQKTFATHGPARIVLSSKLYSWINIFVREARSKVIGFAAKPKGTVFLTWFGEQMESSQINKAIKSVWKKAKLDGNPSSTILRKSAVSQVHTVTSSGEARENLADLMAHNVQTATKYYRLQEKSKSSVEASKQLRTVMRGVNQTASPDSPPLSSNPPASEAIAPNTSRTSWDEDMADAIKTLFKDEIKDKAITLETVKTKISDHPLLKEEDPKRVLDKVRAFWRFSKSPSPEPPCLPTEVETLHQRVSRMLAEESETSSDIIPPTVSSSVRNVFKGTELQGIKKLFVEMIEHSAPISKPQIKKCLEKEDWGQEMLKKVSLDTVVNRIKYEKRLRRASKK